MDQRAQYVQGLRDFADALEKGTMPVPVQQSFTVWAANADDLAKLVKMLGNANKRIDPSNFVAERSFGPITYQVKAPREQVCKRVVVGKKKQVYTDPEALRNAPKLTKQVDIVRWECPESILNP